MALFGFVYFVHEADWIPTRCMFQKYVMNKRFLYHTNATILVSSVEQLLNKQYQKYIRHFSS